MALPFECVMSSNDAARAAVQKDVVGWLDVPQRKHTIVQVEASWHLCSLHRQPASSELT